MLHCFPMNSRFFEKFWTVLVVLGLVVLFGFVFFERTSDLIHRLQRGEQIAAPPSFSQSLTLSGLLPTRTPPATEHFEVTTDDDPSLGVQDAKVTLVTFADFSCPYSRDASYTLRSFMTDATTSVQYIYRDFPLDDIHPFARLAAQAGVCADAQGKFWIFHDRLYAEQAQISREFLLALATQVGLSRARFEACLEAPETVAEVQEDYEEGIAAGVRGTPTFFLNGLRIPGAIPLPALQALVGAALQSSTARP